MVVKPFTFFDQTCNLPWKRKTKWLRPIRLVLSRARQAQKKACSSPLLQVHGEGGGCLKKFQVGSFPEARYIV